MQNMLSNKFWLMYVRYYVDLFPVELQSPEAVIMNS